MKQHHPLPVLLALSALLWFSTTAALDLNVSSLSLDSAVWVDQQLPTGLESFSMTWHQTGSLQSTVVLASAPQFGSTWPAAYLFTLNGYANTITCINLQAGFTPATGEDCAEQLDPSSPYTPLIGRSVASSSGNVDGQDYWLTFSQVGSVCTLATGQGAMVGNNKIMERIAPCQAVGAIGFTTYSDSVTVSSIVISSPSDDLSGPHEIEVVPFSLRRAAWVYDAIPVGGHPVKSLVMTWEQPHAEANVVLGSTPVFGGSGAPQSYMVTLNGFGNTLSCINHHAGQAEGGEACELGNGYTVASSATTQTSYQYWLTFERNELSNTCTLVAGSGPFVGSTPPVAILSRTTSCRPVRFVGFSASEDMGLISDVRLSYVRADFAGIEVPQYELYGAKWLDNALPPLLSFDKITLQWRHNGSMLQSTTLLSPSRNFGGGGDPQSIMVTAHGWGNTMSCISLYTGWTSGGEACAISNGNAVASSTTAAASDVRDLWLTFERTTSGCTVALGSGTTVGDVGSVIMTRLFSLSACPNVCEIGFTTYMGTVSDTVVDITYTQSGCNNGCEEDYDWDNFTCLCQPPIVCPQGNGWGSKRPNPLRTKSN
jgi:hypothetical protein